MNVYSYILYKIKLININYYTKLRIMGLIIAYYLRRCTIVLFNFILKIE